MKKTELVASIEKMGFRPETNERKLVNQYNNLVTGFKKSRSLDRVEWLPDVLTAEYLTRRDLLESLQSDGIPVTREKFQKIDQEVNLARFDFASAYLMVSKAVKA